MSTFHMKLDLNWLKKKFLLYDMPKQRVCQNVKHIQLIVAYESLTKICAENEQSQHLREVNVRLVQKWI